MVRFWALILLMCCSATGSAQTNLHRRVSGQGMRDYLDKKGYSVSGVIPLLNRIPDKDLHPRMDSTLQKLVEDWLAGLNIKAVIDENTKDIQLTYRDSANPGIFADLEGTVRDEQGELLYDATVCNLATGKNTRTNQAGHFRLRVDGLVTTLTISHAGPSFRISISI
jgi:hypothetical protein